MRSIMAMPFFLASVATGLLLVITVYIMRRLFAFETARTISPAQTLKAQQKTDGTTPDLSEICGKLAAALHDRILLPDQQTQAFKRATDSYWAKQESEVVPGCVFQPRDAQELSVAVTLLKSEFDERSKSREAEGKESNVGGLFAVRGGGHSPIAYAASTRGGILIDLTCIKEVIPSEDGSSVVIGGGARWDDVSKVLDAKGLAAVGGRNSDVGVGGLTLGGGISFFSPRYGFVCSNVISYEIVLASGEITTASQSHNPDLWRALKGGSNNFGIVTRFTVRAFPSTQIWSGFLYLFSSQATNVLTAFYEAVKRKTIDGTSTSYDFYAAGPIACFSYIQALGTTIISVNLVYTKLPEQKNKWPSYWQTSRFASLWRVWSTCKVQTLTSATSEMSALNPPGRRQVFSTITVKNDPNTIKTIHKIFDDSIKPVRKCKGIVYTLVLQPLLPEWAVKGEPNSLGFDDGTAEPLVNVSFTANWGETKDDEVIESTIRRATEEMEEAAKKLGTAHIFLYFNYSGDWQRPFEGYGAKNLTFLKEVSMKYDPESLFQRGCSGGIKLPS